MRSATLYRVLALLLVLIAAALAVNHLGPTTGVDLDPAATAIVGLVARAGIGVVAALMGVAGGELLIPTIVLLYGLDIKIAGSLSLAVSLPTMLQAFARYSRDSSFVVLRDHARFAVTMAHGSITGTTDRRGYLAARDLPHIGRSRCGAGLVGVGFPLRGVSCRLVFRSVGAGTRVRLRFDNGDAWPEAAAPWT